MQPSQRQRGQKFKNKGNKRLHKVLPKWSGQIVNETGRLGDFDFIKITGNYDSD